MRPVKQKRLKPGDLLLSVVTRIQTALGASSVSTFKPRGVALVISIDTGNIGGKRPATVTLLVEGPRIVTRDFTWVFQNFEMFNEPQEGLD